MALGQGSYTRSLNGTVDDRRRVTFFNVEVYNEQASMAAGRPIYKMEERIEIAFPGNQLNIHHGRVTDVERNMYAREYEAFMKGEEVARDGTPIEQMTVINKAMAKELKHFDIYTVEDAASLPETVVQGLGPMGFRIREMAKKYLEQAQGFAPIAQLVSKNEDLEGQLAAQKLTIDDMNRTLMAMQAQLQHYAQAPQPPQMLPPVMHPEQVAQQTPVFESALDSLGAEPPKKRGRPVGWKKPQAA
jgi:hypothetical protein